MSIQVNFYTYSKRTNSTARPSGGREMQCEIYGDCTIIAPSIRVNAEDPTAYNYAYIPAWSRYYYVNNWQWQRGIWIASLAVDALASWRDQIADSRHYVLRAAAEYNGDVVDNLYPTLTDVQNTVTEYNNIFAGNLGTAGEYVLGVINNDIGSMTGGTAYYVLSQQQFANLRAFLLKDEDYLAVQEISAELAKTLFNPYQYIVSCKWYPMGVLNKGASVSAIPFGWWDASGVSGNLLNTHIGLYNEPTIIMHNHPQAAARGNYLNSAPYTERELYIQPFGTINIDSSRVINYANLIVGGAVDYITGTCQIWISGEAPDGSVQFLETRTTNVAVDIPISSMTTDVAGALNINGALGSIFKAAGGLSFGITKGLLDSFGADGRADTAGSFISGIGTGVAAANTRPSGGGAPGTFMASEYTPGVRMFEHFWLCVEDDPEQNGRPLCAIRRLGDLPGFIACRDSDIRLPATAAEINTVRSALTAGFFME